MKLHHKLFLLLLFLLPTQLAKHIWFDWSFVYGIRVDYQAVVIYLTDFLVVALTVLWILERGSGVWKKLINQKMKLLLLVLFALVNILAANFWQLAFYKWLRVVEMVGLAFYAKDNWHFFKDKVYLPIFLSLMYTAFIAILQMALKRTLGGPFYYLGERSFTASTPGIALANFFGEVLLRPYATFPHPNAMGGYALVATIFIAYRINYKRTVKTLGVFVGALLTLLSFSQSAWLAAVVLISSLAKKNHFIWHKFQRLVVVLLVALSFAVPVVATKLVDYDFPETIQKRLELSVKAGEVLSKSPVVGVGLGNSIVSQSVLGEKYWYLQPVHNIFLLAFSEVGLVGLLILLLVLHKALEKVVVNGHLIFLALMVILVTGFFDHYWLTLHQTTSLFAIVLGVAFSYNSKGYE